MSDDSLAGRRYAQVYRTSGKKDIHEWLLGAVSAAGGRVLFASPYTRAPTYIGVEVDDERLGVLAYPFRITRVETKQRPVDELRLQVRYGGEASWHAEEHPLGRDIAGVDVTVVVGIDVEHEVALGLDPLRYDPLPMGISVELKDEHVEAIESRGWHVWEREKRAGKRREARAPEGLETVVGFKPERLLDFVRFERQADALGLDPPLRFSAAEAAASGNLGRGKARHVLEEQFQLTGDEILDMIRERGRLATAVRGGVAEHHLQRVLERDPAVAQVRPIDRDGGDFEVRLADRRKLIIECKNASPNTYSDGAFRVEVQKTRASKGDPESRYYRRDQFDGVAACLFSPTGRWQFRFQLTRRLSPHASYPSRVAAMQRVDDSWASSIAQL